MCMIQRTVHDMRLFFVMGAPMAFVFIIVFGKSIVETLLEERNYSRTSVPKSIIHSLRQRERSIM